ncbi:MAG: CAAX protease [Azospirillum brasilense]|nr:MAG: CAAX protease [Azospirillum brasilense]
MDPTIPYCGSAPLPEELWGRWNLDPVLLSILAVAGLAHGWWLAREGRGRQARFALAGWLVLLAAFVFPLCALSSALFSARVAHHMLLVAVAAPLLAAGLPPDRGSGGRALLPALAGAQAVLLWFWHAPSPYAAALGSDALYWIMELSLLLPALLLWRVVLSPERAAGPVLAALLFTTMQMGLLGALLTFAGQPLYAPHLASTTPYGLSPLEDQQLAGLIMWVPASLPYLAAALLRLASLLGTESRRAA